MQDTRRAHITCLAASVMERARRPFLLCPRFRALIGPLFLIVRSGLGHRVSFLPQGFNVSQSSGSEVQSFGFFCAECWMSISRENASL